MTNAAEIEQQMAQPAGSEAVVMIPRVNIHAFCDDQSTAEAMQRVAKDRRMCKAHMNVHLGGISAAIQTYSTAQTPSLLIVESMKEPEGLMADLGHLSHVCEPTTKVIVIGHVNDVLLYREMVRQGISEYIVAPINPVQIIETIGTIYHDPEAKPVGKVVAFVGAKGGVGSSTIAHNVAWLMSRKFMNDTVVADLDMAFGTAALNFSTDSGQGIAEALSASDRVDQVLIDRLLTKCSDRLSLLAAPYSIEREVEVEPDSLETVLDVVRGTVPCVIVDVPNVWTPWTKQVLCHADEVVITATPEIASFRNAKNLIDHLKNARQNDTPPRLVMNQVGIMKRPEIPVEQFAKEIGVQPTAIIPFDAPTFGAASTNGEMLSEVAAKSKAAEAIEALAQILVGFEQKAQQSKSLLSPLMSKLSSLRKK